MHLDKSRDDKGYKKLDDKYIDLQLSSDYSKLLRKSL